MGDGISAAGIADRLYSGNNVTHLAGGKRFHRDPCQLKNADFLDPVSGLLGRENNGIPRFYLSMENAQMDNGAAVGIIIGIKNKRL